ncbi:hypothetical protein EDD93_5178 [Streptomyces sp. 840.1]|nr:hypothetical protein EDD93_5178 [Streptomyces sp. 840.1]
MFMSVREVWPRGGGPQSWSVHHAAQPRAVDRAGQAHAQRRTSRMTRSAPPGGASAISLSSLPSAIQVPADSAAQRTESWRASGGECRVRAHELGTRLAPVVTIHPWHSEKGVEYGTVIRTPRPGSGSDRGRGGRVTGVGVSGSFRSGDGTSTHTTALASHNRRGLVLPALRATPHPGGRSGAGRVFGRPGRVLKVPSARRAGDATFKTRPSPRAGRGRPPPRACRTRRPRRGSGRGSSRSRRPG